MTDVFTGRGERTQRAHKREESHVKTEVETGVMLPQTQEHLGPSEAEREGRIVP